MFCTTSFLYRLPDRWLVEGFHGVVVDEYVATCTSILCLLYCERKRAVNLFFLRFYWVAGHFARYCAGVNAVVVGLIVGVDVASRFIRASLRTVSCIARWYVGLHRFPLLLLWQSLLRTTYPPVPFSTTRITSEIHGSITSPRANDRMEIYLPTATTTAIARARTDLIVSITTTATTVARILLNLDSWYGDSNNCNQYP